jgi:hypothetical protein
MKMAAAKTPSSNPLNPVLYGLLEHKFGEIKIANEGAPAQVERIADPLRPGRFTYRGSNWGEYYCVCCPFCRDQRNRLWVNHQYGADFQNGRRINTHLAHCYNENCLEKTGRLEQLEDMVFGASKRFMLKTPIRVVPLDTVHVAVEPPGDVLPIDELPSYHPAVEYLTRRGFPDMQELASLFGIGVCVNPRLDKHRIMHGRIYIPVYFNRQLVGWQGRYVGDSKISVKYYNGLRKSQALYNYDLAATQPVAVVVEGVPSVWRIGAAGVCIFGKTLSAWQCNTIATTWADKPVFVVLDHDAQTELDQAVTALCARNVNVVPVILPDDRDPADYSRPELFSLLSAAAEAVDVSADLSFLL